jgi:hypothetical protein
MDYLRQDVIEALIFGGCKSAIELGRDLDADPEAIYELLRGMRSEGVVNNAPFEDVEFGPDFDPDNDSVDDPDGLVWLCGRCGLPHPVIDPALCAYWVYCGDPVSRAFEMLTAEQIATGRAA